MRKKTALLTLHQPGGDVLLNGNLEADTGDIIVRAGEYGVYNTGTINAEVFDEKGYTFNSTGSLLGGTYFYDNLDGAATIAAGTVSADQTDTGDLIVTGDITLGADVTFTADNDSNGSGEFSMNVGTSIMGAGYDLTLYSGEDSTLRDINGVDTFTIGSSDGALVTYTSDASEGF